MALSIKDPTVDKNLRLLAKMSGETLTQALGVAVLERLERLEKAKAGAKEQRKKKLKAWMDQRPKRTYKDEYDHKKFTDELWGL